MNIDPRRGLPSAAERRRTNFPLNKDGEGQPLRGENAPAGEKSGNSLGAACAELPNKSAR
jgi:hypothetical protein